MATAYTALEAVSNALATPAISILGAHATCAAVGITTPPRVAVASLRVATKAAKEAASRTKERKVKEEKYIND